MTNPRPSLLELLEAAVEEVKTIRAEAERRDATPAEMPPAADAAADADLVLSTSARWQQCPTCGKGIAAGAPVAAHYAHPTLSTVATYYHPGCIPEGVL